MSWTRILIIAADIANYISFLVDKTKRRVSKSRAEMGLEIVKNEYHSLQGEIQKMEGKITELRYKGSARLRKSKCRFQ
jgi:predicted  nucleic acid-binding Zn-ribbon protein